MKATLFALITLFAVASALHCFVCNSSKDSACGDTFAPNSTALKDTFLKPCAEVEGITSFCRKTKMWFELNGEERVHRDCATLRRMDKECYKRRAEDYVINVCQCDGDGCNAATVNVGSAMTAMLLPLGAIFVARRM